MRILGYINPVYRKNNSFACGFPLSLDRDSETVVLYPFFIFFNFISFWHRDIIDIYGRGLDLVGL